VFKGLKRALRISIRKFQVIREA